MVYTHRQEGSGTSTPISRSVFSECRPLDGTGDFLEFCSRSFRESPLSRF